jgi:hypothetical protein
LNLASLRTALHRGLLVGLALSPWPFLLASHDGAPWFSLEELAGWPFWVDSATFRLAPATAIAFLLGFTATPMALVELAGSGGASPGRRLARTALAFAVGLLGLGLLAAWGAYLVQLTATASPELAMTRVAVSIDNVLTKRAFVTIPKFLPLVVPLALAGHTRARGLLGAVLLSALGAAAFHAVAFGLVLSSLLYHPLRFAAFTVAAGALAPILFRAADRTSRSLEHVVGEENVASPGGVESLAPRLDLAPELGDRRELEDRLGAPG